MTNRIKWLDFAKGITMLGVVIVHVLANYLDIHNYLTYFPIKFIYAALLLLVMPIFFSISGYLYKQISTIKDFLILLYKKIVGLLVPYFIFSLIFFIKPEITTHIPIYYLLLGYKKYYVLWFLPALFIVFVMCGIFDLLKINVKFQILLILIMIIIQPDFWTHIIVHFPILYITLGYSLFFYLGFLLKRYKSFLRFICNKRIIILMSIALVLLMIVPIIFNDFTYFMLSADTVISINLFIKIIGVMIFYALCVDCSTKSLVFKYFDKYGRYTLVIYLCHAKIIFVVFDLLSHFAYVKYLQAYIYLFIVTIIVWISTIIICYITHHISIVKFVFYPRKYIDKYANRLFNK